MNRKSFRGEIFVYFIIIFVLFTFAILSFQYHREKKYRIAQLENTLDNITEITRRFIEQNNLVENNEIKRITDLTKIMPQPNIRITLIDKNGKVIYDSFVNDYPGMENHMDRPEISESAKDEKGSNIRHSETTGEDYFYYAKKYPHYFIRTAIVYDVRIQNFLKAERTFIFFISAIFSIIGISLYFITGKMALAITKLKDFSIKAGKDELVEADTSFPENELGIIGSQIIRIYNKLKKAKDDLTNEKEKLFNHLNALNEGIAFFSSDKKVTLSNRHFLNYINVISTHPVSTAEEIFEMKEFKQLVQFLQKYLSNKQTIDPDSLPQLGYTFPCNEKYFNIQSIIFIDKSFEVMITDNTRLEKRRLMKQQLTSNIAHELKTPLASIKGYLETMLSNRPLAEDKQRYFLEKTYNQSERLTDLINDVSLLNNIEDAGELFKFKPVELKKIIDEVYENFAIRMHEKNISFSDNVKPGLIIHGNDSLLFSIFQNLVENSINYGGEGTSITITTNREDDKYYHLSYTDTGGGIPDEHLPRIFERFYRVDRGRTRDMGGTGLGLAIVKNAVQLHKGEISVRHKAGGGIEFLFSLAKNQ